MLNIITSLSLDALADDMIEKIQLSWNDPFVSPVIVFTDSKTEQWFKLHVLKKQHVLMNLCTTRLESFLFSALKTTDKQALLTPDLLRDVIIYKLLSDKNNGGYLNKIKDKDNIGNYLNITENTDNIDYRHLFDFANDLSRLFIEYEATRTNIDDAVPGDDWQKNLYNSIINDQIVLNDRHYYTCPALAEKNRTEHNGEIVFNSFEQPVFVFGFSGMGQTYRHLLKEFGKKSNCYVYLQTTKNSEDNTNIFLKHWAQFGKKNYELFGAGTDVTDIARYSADTTLGKIQNSIARNKNIADIEDLKVSTNAKGEKIHDDSLTVTSVPSKIKEVEIVHSSICRLLKDKKKNATLKDILVLAPDIDEYKSAVTAVFNQIDETDQEYPFVPFSIVDYSGKSSAVLDALQTLHAILNNGGLTRKTFFNFTKNSVIQNRYQITDMDISNVFQPWLENMRVFRIHASQKENAVDDWENAVNRLLVAKLTDNDKAMPFSDFNTEDNELLTKFVQICDDIKRNWTSKFKDTPLLSLNGIEDLQRFLTELFALNKSNDLKLLKEKIIWEKLNRKLEQYKEFAAPVPLEYVLMSLIDVASNVKFDMGTIFTRGVTFTSLLPNRILSAKYVFLMGMSSENFPGVNKKIVLDRRAYLPEMGDEDIPGKNKNAFLCQLMATGDEMHISFVDKDLGTDNTFYPSYVLDVLTKHTGIKTRKIGIDEIRPWDELYTPREWRGKQTYIDLNHPECVHKAEKTALPCANKERPDTVRLKDFLYFLENPLKCYANRTFGYEEDDTSHQELEDIELNNLSKAQLEKRLVKPMLENSEDSETLTAANYKDLLPDEPFASVEFGNKKAEVQEYIKKFKEYVKTTFPDDEVKIEPNTTINIHLGDEKEFNLRGEIFMYAQIGNDVVLWTKTKEKKADDAELKVKKYYPEMYALIAHIATAGETYNAHLIYRTDDGFAAKIICNITPESVKRKLNEFYKRVFIDGEKRHIPYFDTDIFDHKKDKLKASFGDYKAKFKNEDHNNYYIPYHALFNPDTNLGFTEENFSTEYPEAIHEHGKLLELDTGEE